MGAVHNAFEQYGQSFQPAHEWGDFDAVRDAAAINMETVARHYLPGGHLEGDEWVALNPTRSDNRKGSFKVNLSKAMWKDFASGEGGDAIALVSYLEGKSPLDAARDLASLLGLTPGRPAERSARPRPASQPKLSVCATVEQWRTAPASFPARTEPDANGKPRFMVGGDEGPRVFGGEKRRHAYRMGGVPVRYKVLGKDSNDDKQAFRVINSDDQIGWQYRKPAGFLIAPFVVEGSDPFASEGFLFWPEGEKDTETVARIGLDAFCFGGTGDGLPAGCEQFVTGRNVVILADNDDAGRKHADDKAKLAYGKATSVRIVHFADVDDKGDVTDWIAAGHTAENLKSRAELMPEWQPDQPEQPNNDQTAGDEEQPKARTTLPPGFSFGRYGLIFTDLDDSEKPPVTVAGHFEIEAETRDGEGASWGVLLRWKDHDGREHRLAIPRASLAGDGSDARRMLMDKGFYISPTQNGRSKFNSFLLQVKSPHRARATQRVGWHGNSFVLPDDCFGAD